MTPHERATILLKLHKRDFSLSEIQEEYLNRAITTAIQAQSNEDEARHREKQQALRDLLAESMAERDALRTQLDDAKADLEDAESAVAEAEVRCAEEWERDCARELRKLATLTGFEGEVDGDTADVIGEHVAETIRDLIRQRDAVLAERDVLRASAQELTAHRDRLNSLLTNAEEGLRALRASHEKLLVARDVKHLFDIIENLESANNKLRTERDEWKRKAEAGVLCVEHNGRVHVSGHG